jgi:hypothetical protein
MMRVVDRRDRLGVALGSTEGAPSSMLHPVNGNPYLSPLIVAMRIAAEFAYAETDEAAGRDHVVRLIAAIAWRKGRFPDGALEERVMRLDRMKDRAIQLCFGDDPGCDTGYLCTVAIPGEPLVFEYESAAHRNAVQPLLERCARVLGYAIVGRTVP